jgi:hypothetical protein
MIVLQATASIVGSGKIVVDGAPGAAPASGQYAAGGGGGAGGGVLLSAQRVEWTGSISARGGNGGGCVGDDSVNSGGGAGGGAGGLVTIQATELVSVGTQDVSGGTAASCRGAGCTGTSSTMGQNGAKGRVDVTPL